MAHTKIVQGRSYPHMYTVDMSVGQRKSMTKTDSATTITGSYLPNKRDDVMLVQYLLKRVYQRGQAAQPPLNAGGVGDPHAPITELKVDGLCGPKTQGAINHFQMEMKKNGRSIATDGCVDPEHGNSATSSISKTGYTISWLNKYFWILYPEVAPNIYSDPECPPELKMSLTHTAAA